MKNKKGFTLVEIIVVLVILAILAAIAVPSVIGYVNEAKESRYIQEAHSIYTVVETEVAKYPEVFCKISQQGATVNRHIRQKYLPGVNTPPRAFAL